MQKETVLRLLGGPAETARAIGIDVSAVSQWPDRLTPRIADRAIAALVRAGRHEEAHALATGRDEAEEAAP